MKSDQLVKQECSEINALSPTEVLSSDENGPGVGTPMPARWIGKHLNYNYNTTL